MLGELVESTTAQLPWTFGSPENLMFLPWPQLSNCHLAFAQNEPNAKQVAAKASSLSMVLKTSNSRESRTFW